MTDTIEAEAELKVEDLDKYCEAAAGVVDELNKFLCSHYEELIKCHIKIHSMGATMDMPLAAQDPVYAGKIHGYKQACDAFCNVMRENR